MSHSRNTFEAFLRYKFSQITIYNSSTVCFTNTVEKGWRIRLHVGMSESSWENTVLDRRTFYETRIHWLDRQIVRKQLDIMSTYHYVKNQGKLMMKLRKWPKTSIWAIFFDSWGQISANCKFFWKICFIQTEGHVKC